MKLQRKTKQPNKKNKLPTREQIIKKMNHVDQSNNQGPNYATTTNNVNQKNW